MPLIDFLDSGFFPRSIRGNDSVRLPTSRTTKSGGWSAPSKMLRRGSFSTQRRATMKDSIVEPRRSVTIKILLPESSRNRKNCSLPAKSPQPSQYYENDRYRNRLNPRGLHRRTNGAERGVDRSGERFRGADQ